jgi:hypothetical protein
MRWSPVETDKQRRDRELMELLNELRVALPGVQVLFAFLLVAPFNQRFGSTTDLQQGLYFATLGFTTAACALLIAPSAQHRLLFRRHFERRLLVSANRLATLGLACLALAMIGAVTLVTDFLLDTLATVIAGVLAAALFGTLWYLIPLAARNAPEDAGAVRHDG